jgi:hypothetical protein
VLLVFDGNPPEDAADLVGVGHADDEIVARAEDVDGPVWIVTSDRGLRARVEERAERIVGGGTFAGEL